MQALHSNWTKPRICGQGEFFLEDFEILTTILSALKWRERNGTIKMATDTIGLDFYKSHGLCSVWDEITTELDDIPDCINPTMFWAAGKIYALKNACVPVANMDTDFIVWDKLAFDKLKSLTVIHTEELSGDVYPDFSDFNMNTGYSFNPEFDKIQKPFNCAFYVLKNDELKNLYISEAEEFMKNAKAGDSLTYMVYAEQRLLAMCSSLLGTDCGVFSTVQRLFKDGERYFTHTWGMKQQIRQDNRLRYDFCRRCIQRIETDFKEFIPLLKNLPETEIYF